MMIASRSAWWRRSLLYFPGNDSILVFAYAMRPATFILKRPSACPLTMQRVFELLEQTGLPKGVVQSGEMAEKPRWMRFDHLKSAPFSFCGLESHREICLWRWRHRKRAQCREAR